MPTNTTIQSYLDRIRLPQPNSHKGQNGKVLVIGGSELFHAASQWSLQVVSRLVDMVFYSSVLINNQLIQEAKGKFGDGIVVPREDLEDYIEEADVILIGPGMTREVVGSSQLRDALLSESSDYAELKKSIDWSNDTYAITNYLLAKFPRKKWVIDAGALQMVEPMLLSQKCMITPHLQEFQSLYYRCMVGLTMFDHPAPGGVEIEVDDEIWATSTSDYQQLLTSRELSFWTDIRDTLKILEDLPDEQRGNNFRTKKKLRDRLLHASKALQSVCILLKSQRDVIAQYRYVEDDEQLQGYLNSQFEIVHGGNAGMTKGGTGDVLAGLVAGLYAKHDVMTAAVVGSYVNKKAGDELYKTVGPYFNASDLAQQVPQTLWRLIEK